ncbi:hypothetical protein Barb7_01222 [Bacteroidales bacterium Barb7]|nr:hypothetical protein Barb7_01222 [Bacteroidales bacterium Barb7]
MGRTKGVKMSEEAKFAMRAKREALKDGRDSGFSVVISSLKQLNFEELDKVIALAARLKKEKLGEEELRLIKEKEDIELRLQRLKENGNA